MYYDKYLKYLESEKWAELRNKRLALDNYECAICRSPYDLQVHHLIYPALLGTEHISHLVTLCKNCHAVIEGRKKRSSKYRIDLKATIMFENKTTAEQSIKDLRSDITCRRRCEEYDVTRRVTLSYKLPGHWCSEDLFKVNLEECGYIAQKGFDLRLKFY